MTPIIHRASENILFRPAKSIRSANILIRILLGGVFLVAGFAKAFDSDDTLRAIEATSNVPISATWLTGGLIAFEAGLGASLIFAHRSIIPLALIGATLIAFSGWLVYTDRMLPSLACGCFGASGFFDRELTLGESLARNGLLLFAALVLIAQHIMWNRQSTARMEINP